MKKIIAALLFLLAFGKLTAQTSIGDSLLHIIATANSDSIKIDAVNNIPFGFYDPDTIIYYSQKIITIGLQQKNDLVTAMGWVRLSYSYFFIDDYDKAFEYALKCKFRSC